MIKDLILIAQIVCGVVLIALITIQTKGTGLGRAFGQSANIQFRRRGLEKLIFKLTFVLATVFILVSTVQIFL